MLFFIQLYLFNHVDGIRLLRLVKEAFFTKTHQLIKRDLIIQKYDR